LELPTSDYVLDVKSADGAVLVARYNAPLQTLNLQGAALVVVASGFLNPAVNSNGAAFGLWVALPAGGSLVELPAVLSSQAFDFSTVAIFPNPTSEVLNINIPFSFDTVSGQVIDISGRAVKSINKVENSIDVSNLSNGLYVLDLLIDNKPFKQKFIVSKN
jgi:hypothetical protein